jgi:DNA-binding NtrC family response regulator
MLKEIKREPWPEDKMAEEIERKDPIDLFIIDEKSYGDELKKVLEENLDEEINVKIFPTGELGLKAMRGFKNKPKVVLLDYSRNRMNITGMEDHTVDNILESSPDTEIIIISDTESKERAMKALQFGAQDYVEKDQFAFEHIVDSVKTALNPPKE